jgi:hypothetical protein
MPSLPIRLGHSYIARSLRPDQFYERLTEEAKRGIPKYPTPRIPDDPAKVIDVDPVFKSRTKLVFTDISKGAGGSEVCYDSDSIA